MAAQENQYPVRLSIDYPDRKLNRLSWFFRFITIIPIGIVLSTLSGFSFPYMWNNNSVNNHFDVSTFAITTGGTVFIPVLLLILFRQKYPKWMFDWNLAVYKFTYRIYAYGLLMRDEYPSTDEEQAVHFEMEWLCTKSLCHHTLPVFIGVPAIP